MNLRKFIKSKGTKLICTSNKIFKFRKTERVPQIFFISNNHLNIHPRKRARAHAHTHTHTHTHTQFRKINLLSVLHWME